MSRCYEDPFTYEPAGRLLVGAAAHEIVAYDGATGAPLWLTQLYAPARAVRVEGGPVFVVDAEGTLSGLDRQTGKRLTQCLLRQPPFALAARGERWACAIEGAVWLGENAVPKRKIELTATDLAWGAEDELLIGTETGRLLRAHWDSSIRAEATLPGPITALDARRDGTVLAAARREAFAWRGGALLELGPSLMEEEVASLALSPRGGLLALRAGKRVQVLGLERRDRVAQLSWVDRKVGDVAFGPGLRLAVGLDEADGNIIDLGDGAVHRTDTHPDRQHRSWLLTAQVNGDAARQTEADGYGWAEGAGAGPRSAGPGSMEGARGSPRASSAAENSAGRLDLGHGASAGGTADGGQNQCPNCGARGSRTVCEYCGGALGRPENERAERDAMETFQVILMQASADQQPQLLRSGYLPSSGELLIEAGLRLLSLLHGARDGVTEAQTDSARARLATILLRLEHAGAAASDPRVLELRRALATSRQAARRDLILGLTIIGAGLALLGALIYWLLHR